MKPRIRPLLTWIATLTVTGGALLFCEKVTVLEFLNLDRSQVRLIGVSPSERFSMSYIHSIYDAAVVEEFEVGAGAIILRGVRTQNPRVMEYYGFDSVTGFHPLRLEFREPLIIRSGMRQEQVFLFEGQKIFLGDMADKGDRIQLRLKSVSWGAYVLSRLTDAAPAAPGKRHRSDQ